MKIQATPRFERSIKKLHKNEVKSLHQEIKNIISNPKIGESKKGDLSGVRVHKYKYLNETMLLAYMLDNKKQCLILIGYAVHENFYRDLKK